MHLAVARSCEASKAAILLEREPRFQTELIWIYTDLPLALSTNFKTTARYADELKETASEVLAEETVLVSVGQIYHVV